MKKTISVILSVTMLCIALYVPLIVGAASSSTGGEPTLLTNGPVTDEITVDSGEKRNLLDHSTANNHPTWSKNKDTINGETVVYQEPVLFYTDNGNVRSNVKLMYPVENIVAVTSYTTIGGAFKWYREGTDFTVNIDGTISLTDDSSIPHSINLSEIKYGIGTSGIWNSSFTWQSQLPKNQVLVTYTYTKTWDGVDYNVPTYYNSISTAYDKLSNGDTLDVLFIGDSISTGCNASGQDGVFYTYNSTSVGNTTTLQGWSRYLGLSAKPYWVNDSWDKQVVANIQAAYPNATINVKNRSVGSSASQWYFNHIDELLVTGSLGDVGLENTDLIFIGFGMNEWSVAAATQNANTKKIIDYLRQKNPNVSIVLVSAFYPTVWDPNNQKWTNYRLGEQEDGYFELAKEYENIAVAPVNTAFVNILKAKEGVDYIANGINHPNDYGVNLYADTITATILSCNHKHTTVHQATPSTCQVQGNEEYTTCDKCGEVISGSDAKLPLADHNISNNWSSDANGHWHACRTEGCTHKSDEASHSGGEATCKDKAVCSVCNTAYGEVDVSNHKNTEVRDAKAATCNMPGYTGDTWCLDCNTKIEDGTTIPATGKHVDADGKWESNATQHFHTCGCGTEFDKENHKGGEATCKDKAVCSVCNTAYGEVDASNHKNTEVRDAKKPTEQEKGYTGDTWCTDCNTKIADGKEIDKLEHKPALVKAVAATAAKEGNIEYYYCENCGKYYSDEEGTKEIKKEDTIIAKLAPTVIDGNNAKIDKSSKDPVSFRSDASFADFVRVELDGKELVKDKDYTVKEGSIIVTLTPEFLATLPAGDHTLSIVSVSGTAKADFSVTADKVEDTSSKAESSETTPAKESSEKSPQTGCDLNTILLSLAGIISLAVLSVFAVFKKRFSKSR